MIKHVVMYKLKDNSEESCKALVQKFMSMEGRIPQLLKIETGIDKLRISRSYDVVLICEFNSLEDMAMYSVSDCHLKVKSYVSTVIEESKSVDFEF